MLTEYWIINKLEYFLCLHIIFFEIYIYIYTHTHTHIYLFICLYLIDTTYTIILPTVLNKYFTPMHIVDSLSNSMFECIYFNKFDKNAFSCREPVRMLQKQFSQLISTFIHTSIYTIEPILIMSYQLYQNTLSLFILFPPCSLFIYGLVFSCCAYAKEDVTFCKQIAQQSVTICSV